jgi:hypothetical protein
MEGFTSVVAAQGRNINVKSVSPAEKLEVVPQHMYLDELTCPYLVCVCAYIYIYIYIVYIIYMYVCMYMCVYVYMYIYIYTYVYA